MFALTALTRAAFIGFVPACWAGACLAQSGCSALEIEILRVEAPPSQYASFCELHPGDCVLRGDAVLPSSPGLRALLNEVNSAVNSEIELVSDPDRLGVEEDWDFPQDCRGDCEDFALEKRHRLVANGVPSAAMTMAIVHHERLLFPHAVLLVETDTGTWVLDNLRDDILCWDAVPYRYERREQPGGQWVRFDPF